MNHRLRYLLPPAILVLGVIVAVVMIKSRPPAEQRQVRTPPPVVRVMTVELQDHRFTVESQGTVTPRTEITLTAEVSGRVVSTAPGFAPGGFFEEGEVLVTLESLDYEAAVSRARSELRSRELQLAQEQAQAEVARGEWDRLGKGEAAPLTLREPQVAQAEAARDAAATALRQAERDLDRTRIRAPFTGRIRTRRVDLGAYVTRGTPVAEIYAVDYAEIRLPLPDEDAAFVDLPLGYRTRGSRSPAPAVRLSATFAGYAETWNATIVRTEGEIDPRTRVLYAVARVDDPFGLRKASADPPLSPGLFVNAEIEGRLASGVAVIPRSALRGRDQLLVVDGENQLRIRTVEVLRYEGDDAILASGVNSGDRVCLTPLDAVVDGMAVRTAPGDPPSPTPVTEETPR